MAVTTYVKGYQIDDATGIQHDVVIPLSQVQDEIVNRRRAVVNGGAAGNITVSGASTGDKLEEVLMFTITGGNITNVTDLTAEFTINGLNRINNTGGTATTGHKLLVRWVKAT